MKRKLFGLIFCFVVCIAFGSVMSFAAEAEAYTISEAYIYPILPRTEAWNRMSTLDEKIAACYVDEDLMKNMTTSALLETVLNYPLLVNIYAFDTIETGIESVSSYFKGIEILKQREDVGICLQEFRQARTRSESRTIVDICFDDISAWLEGASSVSSESVEYDVIGITTPSGSPVGHIYNRTWTDVTFTYEDCVTKEE